MPENQKISCARCERTLLVGEINSAVFTVKCKKCGAINLIQVHPQITIQEIPAAMMVRGKIMGISLPAIKPSVRTISVK